jgi:hypothetical protein
VAIRNFECICEEFPKICHIIFLLLLVYISIMLSIKFEATLQISHRGLEEG